MAAIFYVALVVWSAFESVLVTSVIFGWAQLLEVLEKERYFASYCDIKNITSNASWGNVETCSRQDSLLNLVYSLGTFSTFFSSFIGGKFLDVYGFRKTRLLGCLMYVAAGVTVYSSSFGLHEMLFPGLILTGLGGKIFVSCLIKVCGILPSRRYMAVSFVNGAIDSSSVIFLFMKLSYNGGLSLANIVVVYYSFAVVNGLVFTFTLFPKNIRGNQRETILENELVGKPSSTGVCGKERKQDDGHSQTIYDNAFATETSMREQCLEKNHRAPTINAENCLEKDPCFFEGQKTENTSEGEETFSSIIKTSKYILLVTYFSVCCLRTTSFVGMVQPILKHLTTDKDKVDWYLTIFGIIQFSGLAVCFVPGFLLEWSPSGRRSNFSLILSVFLTGSLSVSLTVVLVIPSLQLQMLSFVLYTLLRSFLYSTVSAFIIKEFPLCHNGALFGLFLFVAAIVSLIQIAMFILIEGPCHGDPTMVNIGLLVVQVFVLLYPFYLWRFTKNDSASYSLDIIVNEKNPTCVTLSRSEKSAGDN